MPIFTKSSRIISPFDDVWNFHSNIAGLEQLTPPWMNLKIESVVDSKGNQIQGNLPEGAKIVATIQPFKIGSPIVWNVTILEIDEKSNSAFFRDDVSGKPFQRWIHTHSFSSQGDHTSLTDKVEYNLGGFLSPFSLFCYPLFWVMFTMRHYQLNKLLHAR